MELALLVYGIGLLSNIYNFLCGFMFLSLGLGFFYFMASTDSYDSKKNHYWNMAKRWGAISLSVAFVIAILPSEKTAYTMVGAYAAQKVAENEKVQQLSGKVLKIIEQKLDDYANEAVKKVTK
jgi:hypothetical protein